MALIVKAPHQNPEIDWPFELTPSRHSGLHRNDPAALVVFAGIGSLAEAEDIQSRADRTGYALSSSSSAFASFRSAVSKPSVNQL